MMVLQNEERESIAVGERCRASLRRSFDRSEVSSSLLASLGGDYP